MKVRLTSFNRRCQSVMRSCRRAADSRKVSVYLVGGPVRDFILGCPNSDLDFVIEGDVPAVARQIARDLKGRLTVYPQFRTATVTLADGTSIDLATTRKEIYAHPGALPQVSSGDIHDDLYRRDFTINAMAISVNRRSSGELVDFYNGRADLHSGKIRILHENSFHEDPTRILRAVRFEQRFGFSLESVTARCLHSALKGDVLRLISAERFFQEIKKVLKERRPVRALRRLAGLGILARWDLDGDVHYRRLQGFEDRLMILYEQPLYRQIEFAWLYFMALTEHKRLREIHRLAGRLPLTRYQLKCLTQLRVSAEIVDRLSQRMLNRGTVYRYLRDLPLEVVAYWRVRYPSQRLAERIDRFFSHDRSVRLSLNGRDLKGRKGISGRTIGAILDELKIRKVEGKIHTRGDEWAAVEEMLGRKAVCQSKL